MQAALEKNNTLVLTYLPKEMCTVGCKWVFTLKYKPDGTVHWYKAPLVAKGLSNHMELIILRLFPQWRN